MTTRPLVDPEVAPIIDLFPATPITRENLAETRAAMEARFATLPRPDIKPVVFAVPTPEGTVPILVYRPAEPAPGRPAILHIHGGGMIAGKAELTQAGTAPIALANGVLIASIDYRLAPETPFPGPQEDCYAAVEWLAGNAPMLGIDPARIAISGDSAGGGLAAAVSLMARDRGGPKLAAQLLTYPMLDHRTGGPDCLANTTTGEFMWTRERNLFGWEALRGDYLANDDRKGWFSPALAEDLSGLPQTWIGTGTLDLFFDENLDFARRLASSGVPCELHSWAGGIHGFNMVPGARIAAAFAGAYADALDRLLIN